MDVRWIYTDDRDTEETAARRAVVSRIELFWQAFAANAPRFDDDDFDVAEFMRDHVDAVDPRLDWEIGPGRNGGKHRLVITPADNLALRPFCDAFLARAPQLDGWEFYHCRMPESADAARHAVEALTDHNLGRLKVAARVRAMNRVDLAFWLPDAPGDDVAMAQAELAAAHLLGEEAMGRWIGTIETHTDEPRDGVALEELTGRVYNEVAGIDAALPDRPLVQMVDKLQWSLWRLSPPVKDDYAGHEDLIMGSSALDEMSACAQLNAGFDSRRYSKVGETFCYLKFDGDGRKVAQRMDERKLLEPAVNRALVDAGLGCVVGAGTGKRYSYLDLALTDVRRASDLLVPLAARVGLSRRSWLLFHDTSLGHEWIGLYDDTPPPP